MFIVTAAADGERSGCLVGFATQSSIKPPRFVVCISKQNRTYDVVQRAAWAAVHFLGRDQLQLAELFGAETGDEVDKFELCKWSRGPDDTPVLEDVPGWFVGQILERIDLGDHLGLWLRPHEAADNGGALDLGFQAVKQVDPGHAP